MTNSENGNEVSDGVGGVSNPKSVYYTFRKVRDIPLLVEAMKWDDNVSDEIPVETYKVKPEDQGMFKCSCPAYRECKHYKCVHEAIQDGKIDELWSWMWSERGGWQRVDDIKTVEELEQ